MLESAQREGGVLMPTKGSIALEALLPHLLLDIDLTHIMPLYLLSATDVCRVQHSEVPLPAVEV